MHQPFARTSLGVAVFQIPTCCFEWRSSSLYFAVFVVGRGAMAGRVGMFLSFTGETVFFVTHSGTSGMAQMFY